MDNEEFTRKADLMAKLLMEIDTDIRGNFIYEIGNRLYVHAQGFTGRVFRDIGKEYGLNPEIYKYFTKFD